jgi:hypothetical protein
VPPQAQHVGFESNRPDLVPRDCTLNVGPVIGVAAEVE